MYPRQRIEKRTMAKFEMEVVRKRVVVVMVALVMVVVVTVM